jgi:hypothetical protein
MKIPSVGPAKGLIEEGRELEEEEAPIIDDDDKPESTNEVRCDLIFASQI